MAKPNKPQQPQQPARKVRILASASFYATLRRHEKNKQVLQAFRDFIAHKRENPLAPFGSKDYPFRGNGPLHGFGHAGLTFDASVIYTISGKDPNVIRLYGIFSHDELGTGNPGRPKLQQKNVGVFKSQTEFKPLEAIDESQKVNSPLLKELLTLI